MVQHYSPTTFLRQTSNALLQACFEKQGALTDVTWNGLPEHQIDMVYDRWQDLPESQRLTIERVFEDAEELANKDGLKILFEEGQFHKLDLATELGQFPNYRDKALYVWLNYPRVFEVAGTIHHAHSLAQRYWQRRGGMPDSSWTGQNPSCPAYRQPVNRLLLRRSRLRRPQPNTRMARNNERMSTARNVVGRRTNWTRRFVNTRRSGPAPAMISLMG